MKQITLFEINQPIGTFYLGKINSLDLLEIFEIKRISENLGPQRDVLPGKVNSISLFSKSDKATFPTPIIISIESKNIELSELGQGLFSIQYNEKILKAEIIDGQHRLLGLDKSKTSMDLPIVVMFDLAPEDKAYIFTAINQNQTKVNKSYIYQLFDLSEKRSPQKTCHDIANILNNNKKYPFYQRIKMLGKKKNENEILSQATFIDSLLPLFIPNNDTGIFADFFENNQDEMILNILSNYFSAVRKIFKKEWDDPSYNIIKTTGYGALCKALPDIFLKGLEKDDISESFFISFFKEVKKNFTKKGIEFISDQYGSGKKSQNDLSNEILESLELFR